MPEHDEYSLLLIEVQPRLTGYIYSLVLDRELTKDILQKTNIVLLEKKESFQSGTNFFAWACRVAYHEVLSARRDRVREKLVFGDDVLAVLATESEQVFAGHQDRMEALFDCLARLSRREQQVILDRYRGSRSVGEIAQHLGKTPAAVSTLLTRIRSRLSQCIERKLQGQIA